MDTEHAGRHLVVPEGGEDEVHLDEDGTEGQQAPHERNYRRPQVPLLVGDGRWDALDPAWVVRPASACMPSSDFKICICDC